MRTLQESRDINAIKVLYYPMSVSLLQLWAQLGTWTLCITNIMVSACYLILLEKAYRKRCPIISSVCMNWIGLLIIFVFNSFPHLSPGVDYRWTKELTFPCIIIRTVKRLTGTLSLRTIFFSLAMSRWKHKLKMEERWGSSLSRQSDLCGN